MHPEHSTRRDWAVIGAIILLVLALGIMASIALANIGTDMGWPWLVIASAVPGSVAVGSAIAVALGLALDMLDGERK